MHETSHEIVTQTREYLCVVTRICLESTCLPASCMHLRVEVPRLLTVGGSRPGADPDARKQEIHQLRTVAVRRREERREGK